jgi:isopenicillin N synthase-like dioxygenase
VPGFAPAMEAYYSAIKAAGDRMRALLALSLGLPAYGLDEMCSDGWVSQLLNRYPPVKLDPQAGEFGLGAHFDWDLFTFLVTAPGKDGLQILVDGQWQDVPSSTHPGAFIVNLGIAARR